MTFSTFDKLRLCYRFIREVSIVSDDYRVLSEEYPPAGQSIICKANPTSGTHPVRHPPWDPGLPEIPGHLEA